MARPRNKAPSVPGPSAPPVRWLVVSAAVGLGFALASAWVHYQILHNPFYSSICDVNATFSCTEAYTSRYGAIWGVPTALIGVLYFAFVLCLIAICRRSATASRNVAGYVFTVSTIGLAGVLYFAYASFFILKAVCLLCVGSYAAIIALFLLSGAAARDPMTTLPARAWNDIRTLLRTPAALTTALAFVAAAVLAVVFFPSQPIAASSAPNAAAPAAPPREPPPPEQTPPPPAQSQIQQLEEYLAQQPRVPIVAGGSGAAVVIVKFNDYQCPPCRQTYLDYKPILARLQKEYPGKIAFMTRDFPLDPECNQLGGGHQSACEAAVAVRLAREKGKAEAMEEWLFANQPTLTPEAVKGALQTVGSVSDFDSRYPNTLQLVKGDIAQGVQLGVRGTPTFFMNGIRLQALRAEFFEAAVMWELRHVGAVK
jgi:uncharacterized membrane protein/protein-disulfide isomerase